VTGQQLRVFVSSKMDELAQEREIIKRALSERGLEAWVFERDSGARPGSIQQTYLAEVEAADLYLGIFWKGYGPYTVDEFEQARLLGMDCLVYEKREAIDNGRDPQLQAFLDRLSTVEDGVTIKWFRTAEELGNFAKEDIAAWQARVVREKREKPPCHYVDVPSIQGTLFGRDEVVQQLVRSLREGHIRALAVEGLPGVGKTTLAVAIAHHAGVMRYFRDGVLWASLGQNGTPMNALSEWGAGLDEEVSAIVQPEAVARRVKDAIGTRRMLLILDDIWDIEIANLLRCGGSSCSYLLTTRDKAIAQLFAGPANTLTLEQLRDDDAFEMLRSLAPEAVASAPDTARDLLRAVGSLPLAVSLVGGYLAAPQHGMFSSMFPELRNNAMTRLLQRETRLGLTQARLETAGRQRFSLSETIEWSLQRLPPAARVAFHSVGVFAPKPARFSLEAARAVTDADDAILALLAARNLIELHPAQHELSVHPVLADVARPDADASARFQAHYLAYLMSKKGIDAAYLRDDTYNQIKKAWQTALSGDQLLEWLKHLSRYLRNTRLFGDSYLWLPRRLRILVKLREDTRRQCCLFKSARLITSCMSRKPL